MLRSILSLIFVSFIYSAQAQLRVSSNQRFLETSDGKAFFWLGDTGWLLFSKLDRRNAEKYLEDRRQKGYNVIQAMVLHTVQAKNVYGDSALINKNVAKPNIKPGKKNGCPFSSVKKRLLADTRIFFCAAAGLE